MLVQDLPTPALVVDLDVFDAAVRVVPAHVDPTVACHERMYVVEGEEVVDEWAVDLRGW